MIENLAGTLKMHKIKFMILKGIFPLSPTVTSTKIEKNQKLKSHFSPKPTTAMTANFRANFPKAPEEAT